MPLGQRACRKDVACNVGLRGTSGVVLYVKCLLQNVVSQFDAGQVDEVSACQGGSSPPHAKQGLSAEQSESV